MDAQTIATVIAAVFGSQVLVKLVEKWFGQRKVSAEADAMAADSALKWAERLEARQLKLEDKFEAVQKENIELHKEMARLQVENANLRKEIHSLTERLAKYETKRMGL